MIIKKNGLIKMLKKFTSHIQGAECTTFYVELTIVGMDKGFALEADGMQTAIKEAQNAKM